MLKRRVCLAIAVVMALVMLAGCGGGGSSSVAAGGGSSTVGGGSSAASGLSGDPIMFAFVGPMTGDYSEYGLNFSTACQVARDQINAAGGVLGRPIDFEIFDDKNSPEEGGAVAEIIASNDDFVAVLGHFASGVAMAAGNIYDEVGISLLSASASHPDYSGMSEYMFRNNVLIKQEVENMLQVTLLSGAKNIGVLCLKNDWGQGARAALETSIAELEDAGAEFTFAGVEEFMDGSDDFSSIITKFDNAGCDGIVMLCMYAAFAPFAQQYKTVNPDIILVGGASVYSSELLNLGGEAVNDSYLVAGFNPNGEDELTKNFVADYNAILGKDPDALAGQTFDNVYILAQAIEIAGSTDREAIKDAMYKVQYDGVTGTNIAFDEIGDAQKAQIAFQIQDGEFVVIDPIKLWSDFLASF